MKKFHFNDILIKPSPVSQFSSRSEIDPYDEYGMLPIFTAPMFDVVSPNNWKTFTENKINTIIPRGKWDNDFSNNRFRWVALGLDEFISTYLAAKPHPQFLESFVLIDIANGHMQKLHDTVRKAKEIYGNRLTLMVGNVGHPETYKLLSDAGADYIRVGIGNGSVCLTTQNAAIGYPLASLIYECDKYRQFGDIKTAAKIVADGGIRDYADIIKAINLGADYVMLGSVLNKTFESAGNFYSYDDDLLLDNEIIDSEIDLTTRRLIYQITEETAINLMKNDHAIYKKLRGMSTKDVQREMGKENIKTSEGTIRFNKVEYTLKGWAENLDHYLRSSMSYTNSKNLSQFIGQHSFIEVTQEGRNGYFK